MVSAFLFFSSIISQTGCQFLKKTNNRFPLIHVSPAENLGLMFKILLLVIIVSSEKSVAW